MPYLTNGKIGEMLVNAGLLSADELLTALNEQHHHAEEKVGKPHQTLPSRDC